MKFKSEELINDLIERTKQILNDAEQLAQLSEKQLNRKPSDTSWSALECFEHLNRYGDFYLKEIQDRMDKQKAKGAVNFQSGLLGNYFAKMMLPREKLNKMKTFKDKDPSGSQLDKSTIDKFILQQKTMLTLLDKSRAYNLAKIKTSITISKVLKLRLGDTFRVVIYHNQRHLEQAKRAIG